MTATLLDDALKLMSCGVSIIPIKQDGSKRPAVAEWASYQQRLATSEEAVEWFSDGRNGIAAICGPVSGGLEVMDFDVPGKPDSKIPPAWKPWCEMLKEHGHEDLLEKVVICSTPSGGRHVVYRCKGIRDGNMKLAQCDDSLPLIETRGVGGYFAISPTKGYAELRGAVRWAPEITEAERDILHVCARLLNEKSDRVAYEKNYPAGRRPGDDYNLRGETMAELLMRHGWRPVQGREGRWSNFTRPDKQEGISGGISASTGLFHAFTTSTPFDAGKGYSKFSVYCVLEHAGDFVMAARTLADRGFGGERERSAQVARDNYQSPKYPGTVELSEDEERELWGTLDEFDIEQVIWFWKHRIPVGALTMIQGDPGIGKSTITMAIAAAATVGAALPGGEPAAPCHVVLVATEDDPGKVIRPRLTTMGANLSQISVLATDRKREDGTPIFDGMVTPEMVFRRVVQKRARLLIIDPLIETLAAFGIDPCKSQEVRPFLAKLRNMAEESDCAVILVHHQNKMTGGKALYRSVGSIDIPAAMRSVFVVGSDPDAPEIKAMAHVKSNWAPLQEAIGYTVADGVFGWTGEVSLTAEDMSQPMQTREKRDKATAAREWLEDYLKNGPVNRSIVESVGEDMGHSAATLRRAREALGVKSVRRVEHAGQGRGSAGKAAYYVWQLKDWEDHEESEHGAY